MKVYEKVKRQNHAFLTSALDGGDLSASRAGRFTPEENPPVPIGRRLGGPQSPSRRSVTQLVAWATAACSV
jgi:hypothetical protein